jgi:hypothetical protein
MARPLVADRVKETTQTTGTGTLSLAGVATGFQSFVSAIGTGKQCYYAIVDDPTATTQWEVGIGTVTSGSPNTLSRDRVISSSNSGSKVSWSAGTKTVICTATSEFLNSIIDTIDSDLVTAGTSTVYTLATNRPAVGLYEGRFVCAKMHVASGTTPTLNVDGSGAKTIKRWDGVSIAANDLALNAYYWFKYNLSDTTWRVFSPIGFLAASGGTMTGNLVMSVAAINLYQGSNVASASSLTLAGGNSFNITGTTTITGINTSGWAAGAVVTLRFTDASPPQLTYSGTFVPPGFANYTPKQYDILQFLLVNSSTWICIGIQTASGKAAIESSGRFLARQIFTSSGTYTPTAGMAVCDVTILAGGGSGRAQNSTARSSGGSGAGSKKRFTAADIGASKTVTIGAGGAAVAPTNDGNTGGTSSLGTLLVVTGGGGGTTSTGGAAGTISTSGTIDVPGQKGTLQGTSPFDDTRGGSSPFGLGFGGEGLNAGAGRAGTGYGSGGSGGSTGNSGAGAGGICIIEEYS